MPRETAIRCERPYGVCQLPGAAMRVNGKVLTMWRGEESATEYMRLSGDNGEDWFRISKVIHRTAA